MKVRKVIINRTGANMLNGIISAFVLATDKHGNLDADYACIEVDEIASVGVLPENRARLCAADKYFARSA